jgi:archaellin
MKKIISSLSFILLLGILSVSAQCCSGTSNKEASKTTCSTQDNTEAEVKAYYFHATRRCATCQAVEAVTEETLKELYGDKTTFTSINREEEKDNALIKKYNISGQTLIIVKGDQVINLTNYAFMNARTHPDKLKAKIKTTIDSLI